MVKEADADILRVSRDIYHLEMDTTCQDYANAEGEAQDTADVESPLENQAAVDREIIFLG